MAQKRNKTDSGPHPLKQIQKRRLIERWLPSVVFSFLFRRTDLDAQADVGAENAFV
jgi:hypothetical protein